MPNEVSPRQNFKIEWLSCMQAQSHVTAYGLLREPHWLRVFTYPAGSRLGSFHCIFVHSYDDFNITQITSLTMTRELTSENGWSVANAAEYGAAFVGLEVLWPICLILVRRRKIKHGHHVYTCTGQFLSIFCETTTYRVNLKVIEYR